MGMIEIVSDFYNPRNPKCRACRFWGKGDGTLFSLSERCGNHEFKGRRQRAHNDKACVRFGRFVEKEKG